jgi:Stage II sporulation protein E (SpoIIE)
MSSRRRKLPALQEGERVATCVWVAACHPDGLLYRSGFCRIALTTSARNLLASAKGNAFSTRQDALSWNVSILNSPAGGARCGGDWCDAVAISDNLVGLTIGDVSGHGESAADTMEILRKTVLFHMYDNPNPSRILSIANSVAYSRRDGGVIVTAIVAIFNRRLRTLTFANAGHPPPLVITPYRHEFLAQAIGDLPLGIFPTHRSSDYAVVLPLGSLIVLYTDGVTEHNRDVIRGECELVEACRAAYDCPQRNVASAIARRVFEGGRGHDDAAITALRERQDAAAQEQLRLHPARFQARFHEKNWRTVTR